MARPARPILPALGYGAIWLFLIVFLVYPLLRIFYDAFTDEAGRFTLVNFATFAGDAYYVPPGHTPVHYAGAEIVEFSPTDALAETIPVVLANLQAAGVEA